MERYYQIARCYRDEDFRADRQPEFTQLDIEASFVEQADIIALAEEILVSLWKLIGYDISTPIPHITYHEAMERYGSDKPDLRFGLELTNLTEFFAETPFRVFQSDYVARSSTPAADRCPDASSTHGRTGRSSAEPRAWPTSSSPRTARSPVPWRRTSRRRRRPDSSRRPERTRAMRSSSPPVTQAPPAPSSAPPVVRSPSVWV